MSLFNSVIAFNKLWEALKTAKQTKYKNNHKKTLCIPLITEKTKSITCIAIASICNAPPNAKLISHTTHLSQT